MASLILVAWLTLFCDTETSWAEYTPDGWIAVCGDADGNPLTLVTQ